MVALILGLVLVLGAHSAKIAAPAWRAAAVSRLGEGPYRGLYSVVSLIGLALIVWGFGEAWEAPVFLYTPPAWGRHVAMALMIPALVLAFASAFPARWLKRVAGHHPLLTATMFWAAAHLFANGDLAGVVLFSAFLAWAVVDRIAQTARAATGAAPRAPGRWDLAAVVAGLVLYAVLVADLHFRLFGVSPVG